MQYIESLADNESVSSISNGIISLNSQLNNSSQQSSQNTFSRPYSAKTNFSNVKKIDKKFNKAEVNIDHTYFNNPIANNSIMTLQSNTVSLSYGLEKASMSSIDTEKTILDNNTIIASQENELTDTDEKQEVKTLDQVIIISI